MFFVNVVRIYQFKAKDSELNAYPLWLGITSKDFTVNNMNKSELCGCVYDFSIDYDNIDVDDILNIYKYLMKKHVK